VVEWIQRFGSSVIFFEDLTDMRDDIEYGARMNHRLHSLPFAKLRDFITYKAAWEEIPSDDVDPSTPASNAQFVVTQHGRTDARSGSSAVSANIKTC
jgi:IS605 OrfB family transposase